MFASGNALPGRTSESGPDCTTSPTRNPIGATMYRFSPSAYCKRAIRAERLGSYSNAMTLAGMPSLSRRKSIARYKRLCPAPRKRTVVRPWLFRAAVRSSNDVSDFSGLFLVNSSVVTAVIPRRPDVVGLYAFNPILVSYSFHPEGVAGVSPHCARPPRTALFSNHSIRSRVRGARAQGLAPATSLLRAFVEFEFLALLQFDKRFFPVRSFPREPSKPLDLALNIKDIYTLHFHFQKSFDSLLDLDTIRFRVDEKPDRIALLAHRRHFLGQQRLHQDLPEIDFHAQTSFTRANSRSGMTMTWALTTS